MSAPAFDLVVPTIGRASLGALLAAVAADDGPLPGRVVVVDDRRNPAAPLALALPERLA
ncbi:MAG: transferase, partial [Proteobacteria bacterium]